MRNGTKLFELYRRLVEERMSASDTARFKPLRVYLRQIGIALWVTHRPREALELLGEQDSSSDEGVTNDWRTETVRALIGAHPKGNGADRGLEEASAYTQMKSWMEGLRERARVEGNREAWEDASRAILLLVSEKYVHVHQGRSSKTVPRPFVSNPILVQADKALFPQSKGWFENHPLALHYLPEMRDRIKSETGVQVTGVRFRAIESTPGSYDLLVKDVPVATGKVGPGLEFAPGPHPLLSAFHGQDRSSAAQIEPARLTGLWLGPEEAKLGTASSASR